MTGSHRVILETSIEDKGLSPEFRIQLANIWGRIEDIGLQQRFMHGLAWREAINRYLLMHPEHFSKEKNEKYVFVKGENSRWEDDWQF